MADMDSERDNADRTEPSGPSVDGRLEEAGGDGVLGALPRTRPQRVSPRRAAAQAKRGKTRSAAKPTSPKTARSKGEPAKGEARSKAASGRGTTSRSRAARPERGDVAAAPRTPTRPPAPKQGYEPEEELELGRSVRPPGAVELIESVADIFLELASASLKSGGRALREALSPLRRP
jgi:hypothetical protein